MYNANRRKCIGLGREQRRLGLSLCTLPWLEDNVNVFKPERKANPAEAFSIFVRWFPKIFSTFSLPSVTKTRGLLQLMRSLQKCK